jgi:hypothetical protein
MRVLLDTNLLIAREDPVALGAALGALLRLIASNGGIVLIHPTSVQEVESDRDHVRRDRLLSKLRAYPVLENPPEEDEEFTDAAGGVRSPNDVVDIRLLRAVHANAVAFLLSEDQGLIRRAARVQVSDRVLGVQAGLHYFSQFFERVYPVPTPHLRRTNLHALDLRDPFFDSFRSDYGAVEFNDWFTRNQRAGRLCFRSELTEGRVGSVLILKDHDSDPLCGTPAHDRLKICSLKVGPEQLGFRLGETLVALALEYGQRNRYDECYVTVFPKYGELVALLSTFGFKQKCALANGELVLVKRFRPPAREPMPEPLPYLRDFYPSFRDDHPVRKFIVPIRPGYHDLLFPTGEVRATQRTLDGGVALPPPAGNAVRKAYLCNSRNSRIRSGDVLLFYRSQDRQAITHRGVVEETRTCNTPVEITQFIGNRTVLPLRELERLCDKRVLGILFWNVGKLAHPVGLGELEGEGVSWPQSIIELPDPKYRNLLDHELASP